MLDRDIISNIANSKNNLGLLYVEAEIERGSTVHVVSHTSGGAKVNRYSLTLLLERLAEKEGITFEDYLSDLDFCHKVSPELYLTGKKRGV